jgi:hypothetical protein
MSYAILELHLEQPIFTLERVTTVDGVMWVARCERCGGRSRPRHLISNLLDIQHGHGAGHIKSDAEELEALLSTDTNPLEVTAA